MKVGDIEGDKTKAKLLGKLKVRANDSIYTLPDEKYIKSILDIMQLDETSTKSSPISGKKLVLDEKGLELLNEADAERYRSATGAAMYLAQERRDIMFPAKELARRLKQPRQAD